MGHQAIGGRCVDAFIVIAGVEIAAELAPVFLHDLRHGLLPHRQQIEPEEYRPQTVFLPDMIGTGAKTLLAAERDAVCIQQVAEKFPAGRGLIAVQAQRRRHPVDGLAGRHGTGHPADAGWHSP